MRARGQAGDLPARELDRAVAEQPNVAAQDARRAESRAAGHVEERLIGAGAGEKDFARIIERRRGHLVRRRERAVADDQIDAVGQRPRDVQDRSARAPFASTRSSPLLSRKVVTVFVPADRKQRSDELVIEFTVPIEAEASERRPAGYCDVRAYVRYASRAPVVRIGPIRTVGARPSRSAHDAFPNCRGMPATATAPPAPTNRNPRRVFALQQGCSLQNTQFTSTVLAPLLSACKNLHGLSQQFEIR